MTIKATDNFSIWLAGLKSNLSLTSQQYLEDILTLLNKKNNNIEEKKKYILNALEKKIKDHIEILISAKIIFIDEIEKMSLNQTSYETHVELLSLMKNELNEVYFSISTELKIMQFYSDDINSTLHLIKKLTHFLLAEVAEDTILEPQKVRFNFLQRLKLLLYTKNEGMNEMINSLTGDRNLISSQTFF